MVPRGVLDIGWLELARGMLGCCSLSNPFIVQAQVEAIWSPTGNALACLSVRTGFDLLLTHFAWPAGSEILVSGVTIPDMLRIIAAHGLMAVPLDFNSQTLAIDPSNIAERMSSRTTAVLIAHLFGSRMPMEAIVSESHRQGLVVFEDCAQAFDGGSFRGHDNADASLFSFGPIKTQTALGGALITVRDRALLQAARERQQEYHRRSNLSFLRRLLLFGGLKALSQPRLLGAFGWLVRRLGYDFDKLISGRVRGFAPGDLLPQLRRQAAVAQLRLLRDRLQHSSRAWIEQRSELARSIAANLNRPICGATAAANSHWVLPVECDEPNRLQQQLVAAGFDATRKASSLVVVPAPADRPEWEARQCRRWLERLVYLPLHPALRPRDIDRLAHIVNEFQATLAVELEPAVRCDPPRRAAEFIPAKSP
jgi:perosamine synthetase